MKKWILATLFGTTLVLGACGNSKDDASENDTSKTEESDGGTVNTADAENVFKSNCSSCHGADLAGGAGPSLTKVGATHSADDIAGIIKNGKGGMPAGVVSGDDVTLLADWLAEKK